MMQCVLCRHGLRNHGKIIPVSEVAWFCGRLEGERSATAQLLTMLLLRDARKGECVAYEPYQMEPDGYLSEDLAPEDPSADG